jgi:lipid II:glycine glycyltransferase (peptidoglycan interpeptide bridge formation enzyme)
VPENPYYGLHHYKQGFGAQFHAYAGQCDRVLHPMRAKLVHTLQKIFVRE